MLWAPTLGWHGPCVPRTLGRSQHCCSALITVLTLDQIRGAQQGCASLQCVWEPALGIFGILSVVNSLSLPSCISQLTSSSLSFCASLGLFTLGMGCRREEQHGCSWLGRSR